MKKYELIKVESKRGLYRIRALRDINVKNEFIDTIVKKGTLGGYIEGEHNLSQDDNSWVFENGVVKCNAKLINTALISGTIRDGAIVINSKIEGKLADIYNNAIVKNSIISNTVRIYENAIVRSSDITATASSDENDMIYAISIYGNATVVDCTILGAYTEIYDNATVNGTKIEGKEGSSICNNAKVINCEVLNNSYISDNVIAGYATINNSDMSENSSIYRSTIQQVNLLGNSKVINSLLHDTTITGKVLVKSATLRGITKLDGDTIINNMILDNTNKI